VFKALGKALKTLGEGFAECDTQPRKLGELYIDNDFFAECHSVLGKEKLPSRRQVTMTEPVPSVTT
jgi:hypothetical protein